jgi:hypothetical protein
VKQLQIQVRPAFAFTDDARRRHFATFAAGIFAAGPPAANIPYAPSHPSRGANEYVYVIDPSNDWRVMFDRADPRRVELWMRYHDQEVLAAATRFVAYRFGLSDVVEVQP